MIDVQAEVVRDPRIPQLIDRATSASSIYETIGQEAVTALEGVGSFWPVDTGISKAGFVYNVEGRDVLILNVATSADGFSYPQLLESRGRYAERTLDRALDRILDKADARLDRALG